MTEEAKKGMTQAAINVEVENEPFMARVMEIMRTGNFTKVKGGVLPGRIEICPATAFQKALATIRLENGMFSDLANKMLDKSVPVMPEVVDLLKKNPLIPGAALDVDSMIVALAPLTEEQMAEQMHREVDEMLGQILGGMGPPFTRSPFGQGPFSHGMDDIFGTGVHVVHMSGNPMNKESSGDGLGDVLSKLFGHLQR